MQPELEQKLLKAAPYLYTDRYRPPNESCLAFGFECGNGWFDLLMEASVKLEALIVKYIAESESTKCYRCGCDVLDHSPGNNMPCTKIHYLPYHFGGQWRGGTYTWCWQNIKPYVRSLQGWKWILNFIIWRRIQAKWYNLVNRWANRLYEWFNIGYYKPCWCKGFQAIYPRATQVKEKYATLRLYMNMYSDEIDEIIHEAERKSAITCECCGEPGELRDNGWYHTLCDDCNKINEETGRVPWSEDEL